MNAICRMRLGLVVLGLVAGSSWAQTPQTDAPQADTTEAAERFVRDYEKSLRPLEIAVNRAWWTANISGKDQDFAAKEAAENQLNEALADRTRFTQLQQIKNGRISDPILARMIDVLYLQFQGKQVSTELLKRISSKANAIEKSFNVFRAQVGTRAYSDSEVRRVLTESNDSEERRQVWEASKRVGERVEQDLRELVFLRNESARQLGFDNYHALQLALNEQNQAEVLALFDQLDELTREPFAKAKAEIDRRLAERYGVKVDELRPWHCQDPFFQEAPAVYAVDLDSPFAEANIPQVCRTFYAGIGLPIDDVIDRSDLYEKPGKSPHAFCTDIDREGDVRVLANIVPNHYWMSTTLHELGHAVYSSKNIPASMPYVLRTDSHILTTEGVAMMFERFAASAQWLSAFGVQVDQPTQYDAAAARMRRDKLLIFSRWCQVMLRFEVELYRHPEQDLNQLWWDLVENYQLVQRPKDRDAPDYAAKIHIVSAPCYYHNYMMGQLFACQLHAAIAREVLQAKQPSTAVYTRDPRVGEYMKQRVFGPGKSKSWNDLTRFATGQALNASAFAAEFRD